MFVGSELHDDGILPSATALCPHQIQGAAE